MLNKSVNEVYIDRAKIRIGSVTATNIEFQVVDVGHGNNKIINHFDLNEEAIYKVNVFNLISNKMQGFILILIMAILQLI